MYDLRLSSPRCGRGASAVRHADELEPGRRDQVEIVLVSAREVDVHSDACGPNGLRQIAANPPYAPRQR